MKKPSKKPRKLSKRKPSKYARMRYALVVAHNVACDLSEYPLGPIATQKISDLRKMISEVLGWYSVADVEEWRNRVGL